MKAAQINQYGGADVVKISQTDVPIIEDNQVLIEVHAASLNPFDSAVREGRMRAMKELNLPVTLGGDVAGVITKTGSKAAGFSKGDSVYGQASVFGGGSGAFAEFASTNSSQIAKMPNNIDFYQAASLPLTGVSALQALKQHLDLQPRQKILIQGGSGGIGTIAIQLAKHIGAYVATTTPPEGLDYAKELGADKVIDYKSQDFSQEIHDYDAVFDLVGDKVFNKSIACLKPGGKAVSMVAQADQQLVDDKGISAITQGTKVNTVVLNELTKLIENNVLKANIDRIFELSKIQEAFYAQDNSSLLGKAVIKVK